MKRGPVLERVEKLLIRLIIVTAMLLVMVQGLVVNEPIGHIMARVGTDVVPSIEAQAHWSEPRITLYLENYSTLPYLKVLVNGRQVGTFNNRYVTFPVQQSDVVEIDGSYYQREIWVKALNITSDVDNQLENKRFILQNNIVPVCTVRIK